MHVKKAHRYAQTTRQFTKIEESNLSPMFVILLPAAIFLLFCIGGVIAEGCTPRSPSQGTLKCPPSSSNKAATSKKLLFFPVIHETTDPNLINEPRI